MCFSAEASFVTAGILIPAGVFALSRTVKIARQYAAFAFIPFAFGIQQIFEGGVWLSIETNSDTLTLFSLGFLFFSHFFWPVWVPYSCYVSESIKSIKRFFFWFSGLGFVFGLGLFVPVALSPDELLVTVRGHSIHYALNTIYDDFLPFSVVTFIYATIILSPLLFSTDRYQKIFGLLILVAGIATWLFYELVFISVWCYFAAVLSLYLSYLVFIHKQA